MIEQISIRDLGVIGHALLPLGPGFTALTGETGAGKTMVVTALGLLLGGRADAAAVRSGASQAVVDGQWLVAADGPSADRVREAGGELDPVPGTGMAGLLLSRALSSEGRSRAVVGGRTAPIGVLAELGQQLVVVHGQSDQVRLRSAAAQREALDRFAGRVFAERLEEYQLVYRRWQSGREELDSLLTDRDRRTAEELRLAMAEIDAVAPRPGEDVELAERSARLSNLEDLRLAAGRAHQLLSSPSDEEGDVLTLIDSARRLIERASDHDTALGPIGEALAGAAFTLNDISLQLSGYLGELDLDGARELEAVQQRRSELVALMRRYGPSLDETIAFLDLGSARLLELDSDSDRITALGLEVEADYARALALAEGLSQLRAATADRLSEAVTAELGTLAMADARLSVELESRAELSLHGRDMVSLLLQPHPGAEPRPLGRGASGGELSRVMLAIEVVLAGNDPVPTFVFDEIDAGVGGASAIEVGRRLAMLARTAQVIVVTHLAQVAAFASNHLGVVKDSDGTVTVSSVRQLEGDERAAEMARLLSGLPDSASGLAHARELLELAAGHGDS